MNRRDNGRAVSIPLAEQQRRRNNREWMLRYPVAHRGRLARYYIPSGEALDHLEELMKRWPIVVLKGE